MGVISQSIKQKRCATLLLSYKKRTTKREIQSVCNPDARLLSSQSIHITQVTKQKQQQQQKT